MRRNVIKIDLHAGRPARTRFYRPGTLFGVAKSLIKVRLAEPATLLPPLLSTTPGVQDSGIHGPGFIKRDLIRGCQDPFRVCFQLVFTTALSLRAFHIIDAIVRRWRREGKKTLATLALSWISFFIRDRCVLPRLPNFLFWKRMQLALHWIYCRIWILSCCGDNQRNIACLNIAPLAVLKISLLFDEWLKL